MQWGPAEQQAIIMDVANGHAVDQAKLDWAVRLGYVIMNDEEPEVTDEGWDFFHAG
ncbi:hypothetical protein H9654_00660 [Stenotrophomonas sp. Sa5BUN4]|uniref:Uncharacterized protein n=1 Tax=Stenotrophomonas lacuserhaii TaxID=2760084 RepID=A0A8X8FLR0_9GAMM|nr:hypothetical protein [Stenotrophomonas pennii]MBD7952702.1 hypothetical protein [Stenotrophomonas pennii]